MSPSGPVTKAPSQSALLSFRQDNAVSIRNRIDSSNVLVTIGTEKPSNERGQAHDATYSESDVLCELPLRLDVRQFMADNPAQV